MIFTQRYFLPFCHKVATQRCLQHHLKSSDMTDKMVRKFLHITSLNFIKTVPDSPPYHESKKNSAFEDLLDRSLGVADSNKKSDIYQSYDDDDTLFSNERSPSRFSTKNKLPSEDREYRHDRWISRSPRNLISKQKQNFTSNRTNRNIRTAKKSDLPPWLQTQPHSNEDFINDSHFRTRNQQPNFRYRENDFASSSSEHGMSRHDSSMDLYEEVRRKKKMFSNETPLNKNFYIEHPNVTNRPKAEIDDFLDKYEISINGPNSKLPIFKFEEANFPGEYKTSIFSNSMCIIMFHTEEIVNAMTQMEFDKPSPIQSVGWPHALSGLDTIGVAQTGSGKTLSFVLPAIVHAMKNKKRGHFRQCPSPSALVMCPTRELALQVSDVARGFGRVCRTRCMAVFGGQSKVTQLNRLNYQNPDILVATPGRLLDFINTGEVSLDQCGYVVLDEADRMLDMGFEPQIRAVMSQIRPDRQVLMFTATWPYEIQDLAYEFISDGVHVKIGAMDNHVNMDISHKFIKCEQADKLKLLMNHLNENVNSNGMPTKTLVFSSRKSYCNHICYSLRRSGFICDHIHGDRSQLQRDTAMQKFRTGVTPVLIASDVASRGIDVSDIEYVVNFDLPANIDSYIHRIGRTGRAGRKGTAISYITREDHNMVKPLMNLLQSINHDIPPVFDELLRSTRKFRARRTF